MSDSSPLLSLLGHVGTSVASAFLGQHFTRQNMQASYQYGQSAQKNSLVNFMHSAQAAGINPAIAAAGAGSAFSNPVGPSAPQGHAPQIPNFIELSQVMQNEKLVQAQADYLDAETDALHRKNIREASEDSSINYLLRNYYKSIGDDHSAESINDYDLGSLSGLRHFEDYITEIPERRLRIIDAELMSKIKSYQSDDHNGIWQVMAKLPVDNRLNLYREMALKSAQVNRIASSILSDNFDRIESQVRSKKMLADIDRQYNTDFVGHVKNGDYLGSLLVLFGNTLNAFSGGLGSGSGFGVGNRFNKRDKPK